MEVTDTFATYDQQRLAEFKHGAVRDYENRKVIITDKFTKHQVSLDAGAALELLVWLEQHRTELEQMAQEDMITLEGIMPLD